MLPSSEGLRLVIDGSAVSSCVHRKHLKYEGARNEIKNKTTIYRWAWNCVAVYQTQAVEDGPVSTLFLFFWNQSWESDWEAKTTLAVDTRVINWRAVSSSSDLNIHDKMCNGNSKQLRIEASIKCVMKRMCESTSALQTLSAIFLPPAKNIRS